VEPVDLEAALVAAKAGDASAMAPVFRAVHPGLLAYARRHVPDVAEDVVSETWLAATKGFTSFEGGIDAFRAWMYTIARRRIADHYRRAGRRPRLVGLDEAPNEPVDVGDRGFEQLSGDEAIEALLRHLPPEQAEVVLLRVVADLSVDQVAQVMDRSAGSVRVLQHRALRRLAKIFEPKSVTR